MLIKYNNCNWLITIEYVVYKHKSELEAFETYTQKKAFFKTYVLHGQPKGNKLLQALDPRPEAK